MLAAPQVEHKYTSQVKSAVSYSRVETAGVGGKKKKVANSNRQAELLLFDRPAKEQKAQITGRTNRTRVNQQWTTGMTLPYLPSLQINVLPVDL